MHSNFRGSKPNSPSKGYGNSRDNLSKSALITRSNQDIAFLITDEDQKSKERVFKNNVVDKELKQKGMLKGKFVIKDKYKKKPVEQQHESEKESKYEGNSPARISSSPDQDSYHERQSL